jgi:hypothetical protein
MERHRLWTIAAVLAMTVVAVLGFIIGIQPQLGNLAVAEQNQAAAQQRNTDQAAVVAALKKQFAGLGDLQAELLPLQASVPSDTELPAFVTQLDALAGATGVTLSSLTVADAQPYTPAVAPVAAAATDTSDSASATPTPAASAAPTAGVPPVTSARITAANFASVAVQITVTGTEAGALDFVHGLQTGSRLFLVTGLKTSMTDTPGSVDATITGLIYVLVPLSGASPVAAG